MFCSKCGAKWNEDARFCATCGSPVLAADTPSARPGMLSRALFGPTGQPKWAFITGATILLFLGLMVKYLLDMPSSGAYFVPTLIVFAVILVVLAALKFLTKK